MALLEDGAAGHPAGGLPVGATAPTFEAATPEGWRFRSGAFLGVRHVIALADQGCRACDELVPDLLAAAVEQRVPPVVTIVGAPADEGVWHAPVGSEDRAVVVLDERGAIARAFDSDFTPHVFVVDEGGSIAAKGPAGDVAAVAGLVREAEGIRIVTEASRG